MNIRKKIIANNLIEEKDKNIVQFNYTILWNKEHFTSDRFMEISFQNKILNMKELIIK